MRMGTTSPMGKAKLAPKTGVVIEKISLGKNLLLTLNHDFGGKFRKCVANVR